MDSSGHSSDWIFGSATVATMLGILTFALFPFALPGVILVMVATLLLTLPLLVLMVVAAILAGTGLGIRAAGRGITRARAGLRAPEASRGPLAVPRRRDRTHHRARSET